MSRPAPRPFPPGVDSGSGLRVRCPLSDARQHAVTPTHLPIQSRVHEESALGFNHGAVLLPAGGLAVNVVLC